MPNLDLNVLPLYRQDGQDRNDLPGFYMVTPPRRTARGRDADRLLLHLSVQGNAPLEDAQIEALLLRLAQTFYKVPGSITAALRTCADQLNQSILERNLRGSNSGRQGIGILAMAVLREDRLTLAHCGPAHTFVITPQEAGQLHDPQGSRGLGLTRSISLRFFQVDLHPNDLLVLVAQPPPTWTILAFQNLQTIQGAETLRRRLLSLAGANLSAVIIQVLNGSGKLRFLRPKAPVQMATPMPTPAAPETSPEPDTSTAALSPESIPDVEVPTGWPGEVSTEGAQEPGLPPEQGAEGPWETIPPDEVQASETTAEEAGYFDGDSPSAPTQARSQEPSPGPEPTDRATTTQSRQHSSPVQSSMRPARSESTPSKKRAPSPRAFPRPSLGASLQVLAPAGRFIKSVTQRLLMGLHALLKHLLPDESLFNIPASTMVFIAVAVAVIIATSGGVVYFQRGRQVQYAAFFDQAKQAAEQAQAQTDPNEVRTGWETVLDFLDQADSFAITDPSKDMRLQAHNALDQLDSITRLEFQPVIAGGLNSQVRATHMVATDTDLYLLNSNSGNVLRAVRTGNGYKLDEFFECGPNLQIGPLIDISLMGKGNELGATILGMDARGNLLYCIPGDKPVSRFPNLPQAGDQGMRAFALEGNTLYILDPGNNSVWYYRNMEIDQPPHTYFGPDRPDDVQGIIDMAVNRDDLFLLHKDGYMIKCVFGGLKESPTRCDDPAMYTDSRPGRKTGPVILDARFDQLVYTPPPDPSLYLLDPVNAAVYHFGLRLSFQRQFRPLNPNPEDTVTTFAIAPNRTLFLVSGNQILSVILP